MTDDRDRGDKSRDDSPGVHSGPALTCVLRDEAATLAFGAATASVLEPGALVTLSGELGAGKTTFVRGLLGALGWTGAVRSPTYTLVEHYEVSRLDLYHFDLYRFKDPSEWWSSGLEETGDDAAIRLIEWPERAGELLPAEDLHLILTIPAAGRMGELRAGTARGERWLASLRRSSPS